jgi:N-methylhydantoinase B
MMKKSKTKPWGIANGGDGENGYAIYWPETEKEEITGTNYQPVNAGDRVFNFSGGGGGWGDPFLRDPDRVLDDVRNDYVSVLSARKEYGVVIDLQTMTVDADSTERLRQQATEGIR